MQQSHSCFLFCRGSGDWTTRFNRTTCDRCPRSSSSGQPVDGGKCRDGTQATIVADNEDNRGGTGAFTECHENSQNTLEARTMRWRNCVRSAQDHSVERRKRRSGCTWAQVLVQIEISNATDATIVKWIQLSIGGNDCPAERQVQSTKGSLAGELRGARLNVKAMSIIILIICNYRVMQGRQFGTFVFYFFFSIFQKVLIWSVSI